MTRGALGIAALVLVQPPDFSGTWTLDPETSRIVVAANFAGLIGAGAPERLHITQPVNGTLLVESEINESHARLYRPGGTTSTPVFLGEPGTITTTTRWEGSRLVSEGRRESSSTSAAAVEVKEAFELGADGRTLEIVVTTKSAEGESSSRLVYTRTHDVGPCESWATPCKSGARANRDP